MKILFLQKRILFPTNDGGKVRTLNIVRHLARWHDLTYLCNLQTHEVPRLPDMQALGVRMLTIPWRETPRETVGFYRDLAWNLVSRYPFTVAKDYDRRLRAKAVELLRQEPFDLVVCDFMQMARNAIGLPGPPRVLFTHNVEAEIFHRHARTDPGWLRRRYMAIQWRKMRRFEAAAGREFDSVVAVSERDREMFAREYGWQHVRVIDTAVDTEYYRHSTGRNEVPDRIAFVSSMDWLPNSDGIKHFVREIWPRIRAACPTVTFHLVGRNPTAEIRRLAQLDGIEVFPNAPDVRPHLAEAAVVVVPLLVGGGTRLKIFEAMAMGKAVVSTSLGAEGLKVVPGEHIELADDPETFARKVTELIRDRERRSRLAATACRYVCENFSAQTVARQFEQICRETAEGRRV